MIKSDIVTKGIPYGDIVSINYFELNKEPEEDELLKILYKKIKQNEPYTEDIHLYSELNWSKVKLKKFIKTTDKKLLFF